MKALSWLVVATIIMVLAGCGSGDSGVETKPNEVKVSLSREDQDLVAQRFKNWDPKKSK